METAPAYFDMSGADNQQIYRERLIRFYKQYDPRKLLVVEDMLTNAAGNEEKMFEALVFIHGPEPEIDDDVSTSGEYDERLRNMYSTYNPSKLRDVNNLLTEYRGRESILLHALVGKYGPEPPRNLHRTTVTVRNFEDVVAENKKLRRVKQQAIIRNMKATSQNRTRRSYFYKLIEFNWWKKNKHVVEQVVEDTRDDVLKEKYKNKQLQEQVDILKHQLAKRAPTPTGGQTGGKRSRSPSKKTALGTATTGPVIATHPSAVQKKVNGRESLTSPTSPRQSLSSPLNTTYRKSQPDIKTPFDNHLSPENHLLDSQQQPLNSDNKEVLIRTLVVAHKALKELGKERSGGKVVHEHHLHYHFDSNAKNDWRTSMSLKTTPATEKREDKEKRRIKDEKWRKKKNGSRGMLKYNSAVESMLTDLQHRPRRNYSSHRRRRDRSPVDYFVPQGRDSNDATWKKQSPHDAFSDPHMKYLTNISDYGTPLPQTPPRAISSHQRGGGDINQSWGSFKKAQHEADNFIEVLARNPRSDSPNQRSEKVTNQFYPSDGYDPHGGYLTYK